MDFNELWEKFRQSESVKRMKDIADMTEEELEKLGRRVFEKSKDVGDKGMEFLDTEGSKLFERAKKKFKELENMSKEEILNYFDKKSRDKEDVTAKRPDSDEILDDEDLSDTIKGSDSDKRRHESSHTGDEFDKEGAFIDRLLEKIDADLESAESLISDKTNLQALEETDLIPDDFIEMARRYADTSLSHPKKGEPVKPSDKSSGSTRHIEGDFLIDDAIVEEE